MGNIGHTTTQDAGDAAERFETAELSALVDDMLAARAALARAQAAETRVLSAAVELVLARSERRGLRRSTESDLVLREVAAELATAMHVSDRTVQRRMSGAFEIANDYAPTLEAWEQGRIDAAHVSAIVSAGGGLDADARERFEQHALAAAETTSAGRMQDLARAIAARIDPDGTTARIRDRQLDRGVRVYDLGDGMSRLLADLPAVLAHAIHDRLTQQARAVREGSGGSDGSDDPAPEEPGTGADADRPDGADADGADAGPTRTARTARMRSRRPAASRREASRRPRHPRRRPRSRPSAARLLSTRPPIPRTMRAPSISCVRTSSAICSSPGPRRRTAPGSTPWSRTSRCRSRARRSRRSRTPGFCPRFSRAPGRSTPTSCARSPDARRPGTG